MFLIKHRTNIVQYNTLNVITVRASYKNHYEVKMQDYLLIIEITTLYREFVIKINILVFCTRVRTIVYKFITNVFLVNESSKNQYL